jgi:hypothetical protein
MTGTGLDVSVLQTEMDLFYQLLIITVILTYLSACLSVFLPVQLSIYPSTHVENGNPVQLTA